MSNLDTLDEGLNVAGQAIAEAMHVTGENLTLAQCAILFNECHAILKRIGRTRENVMAWHRQARVMNIE